MLKSLLLAVGWLAAILAGSVALCLAVISIRPSMSAPWKRGRVVDVVSTRATPPPSPAPAPEGADPYPSSRIAFDRTRAGRLYAAAWVSEDGGRTWRPLASDGSSVRLLGGTQALAPAPGPDGRLLVSGVLFEEPGVATGLGAIARAAEWRNGGWAPFGSTAPDTELIDKWSDLRARAIGYTPDGTAVIAAAQEIATSDGRSWPTPGRLRSALVSATGAIYAAISDSGRFGLYRADTLGAPWMPLAGAGAVDALAETAGAILVVSSSRLGRLQRGQWRWTDLPSTVRPRELAAHPTQPLVALWGEGRLLISADGGMQFRESQLGFEIDWAAWDPFTADTLTLVERDGRAHVLSLRSLP